MCCGDVPCAVETVVMSRGDSSITEEAMLHGNTCTFGTQRGKGLEHPKYEEIMLYLK